MAGVVAQILPLAQEIPYAVRAAINKKEGGTVTYHIHRKFLWSAGWRMAWREASLVAGRRLRRGPTSPRGDEGSSNESREKPRTASPLDPGP